MPARARADEAEQARELHEADDELDADEHDDDPLEVRRVLVREEVAQDVEHVLQHLEARVEHLDARPGGGAQWSAVVRGEGEREGEGSRREEQRREEKGLACPSAADDPRKQKSPCA